MTWITFILFPFFFVASAQEILIPSGYVQQNQHTAFFVSLENNLTSQCSLADVDQWCEFEFEDNRHDKFLLRVPYLELAAIHAPLLESLKKLKASWNERFPLGPLRNFIFLTRENDSQALDQLIAELEAEPLPLRVLQPQNHTRPLSAYIYSRKKAQEIFALFQHYLLRTENGSCRTGCDHLLNLDPQLLRTLITE